MESILTRKRMQLADYHQQLLDLAKNFSEEDTACEQLGQLLLGKDFGQAYTKGGISELNNDGSALQLCLSSSLKGIRFRMIADPVAHIFDASERLKASLECIDETLRQTGTEALLPICQQLVKLFLSKKINLNAFDRGFCWLGASPNQKGLALYLDTRPFGQQKGWDLISEWLGMVLPDPAAARQTIEKLRPYAMPASFGFEGLHPSAGRAKFYWRLNKAISLSELQIAPLATPEMAHFLQQVIGKQSMSYSGMVMSAGFDLKTGLLEDVKTDLCGHCIPKSSSQWQSLVKVLTTTYNLPDFSLGDTLEHQNCEVAFLGMGMDVKGQPRMNLYLKPYWAPSEKKQSQSLQTSVKQALDQAAKYLLNIQSSEGSWTDYNLPVGHAVEWVTAYTGLALAAYGKQTSDFKIKTAAQEAANYLTEKRAYPQGWGYNAQTGADADSSGFAIRLLRTLEKPISSADETYLLSYWKPTGGFCTYHQDDHWGAIHPCVTAAAALSLSPEKLEELRPALSEYLNRVAPENGEWPTYWWYNHLYSTYQHLVLLDRLELQERDLVTNIPMLKLSSSPTAFELALAAGIAYYRQQDPSSFISRLLSMQKIDGRFPGGYNLRVTDPDCDAPWQQLTGTYYKDIAGTITTATVIETLTKILNHD